MKKLAWAARGLATVSGALLVGALVAAPASADDTDQSSSATQGTTTCTLRSLGGDRDQGDHTVDSAVVDFGTLEGTVFRVTTAEGHAFLNDSRNSTAWIDLTAVRGTPTCVVDASVAVTESTSTGTLFLTVVGPDGTVYGAACTPTIAPFTTANIGTLCGVGFTPIY
ncbi:hypothetical protein [Streptomyces sp. NPDC007264]|uniref:hypothetical protein n=1 Tax=Streptomyces sp. NPDC007264 TaxID=3364777 RepID=UPI0036DB0395